MNRELQKIAELFNQIELSDNHIGAYYPNCIYIDSPRIHRNPDGICRFGCRIGHNTCIDDGREKNVFVTFDYDEENGIYNYCEQVTAPTTKEKRKRFRLEGFDLMGREISTEKTEKIPDFETLKEKLIQAFGIKELFGGYEDIDKAEL